MERNAAEPATEGRADRRADLLAALLAAALAVLVYLPSLGGGFVYDDRRQILENHLIQRPGALPRALAADVWAFKGEREEAWSNYWRPAFVLWLAGLWRACGAQPLGWHVATVLLHALVTALAFGLLRALRLPRPAALAAAVVFAVHPAHVESVAWISGAPDLLMAAPLLGSLWLVAGAARDPAPGRRLVAAGLTLAALLAKEAAVVAPLLVFLIAAGVEPPGPIGLDPARRRRRALGLGLDHAAAVALYLLARQAVLGRFEIATPWRLAPLDLAANVPALACFYLRQALLPLALGHSYPLRAVTRASLGMASFWLPLAVLAAAVTAALWCARRWPETRVPLALFALPLLPAFNINAFLPEQLVHDRYLYLPLLGIWAALAAAAWRVAVAAAPWPSVRTAAGSAAEPAAAGERRAGPDRRGRRSRRARSLALAGTSALGLALAVQTLRYEPWWRSDLALWTRAVAVDPTAAFNWAQYAEALADAGRLDAALAAAERSLAIAPATTAYFIRARVHRAQGRLEAARRDLETVLAAQPESSVAHEQLALVHQARGELAAAAAALERGRARAPHRRCAMSSNLAVVRYLQGRMDDAMAELETARAGTAVESNPPCALVPFRLAALYLERGRRAEAVAELERFLAATPGATQPDVARAREQAQQQLARLRGQPGP